MTRVTGTDGTDARSLTEGEIEGRAQIDDIVTYLVNYVAGFENAYFTKTAPFLGIRETRRIVGEYVMTQDDVLSCRHFDDSIAVASYPIDIHRPGDEGCTLIWCGDCYDIPYRSLVPQKVSNLLVAGRSSPRRMRRWARSASWRRAWPWAKQPVAPRKSRCAATEHPPKSTSANCAVSNCSAEFTYAAPTVAERPSKTSQRPPPAKPTKGAAKLHDERSFHRHGRRDRQCTRRDFSAATARWSPRPSATSSSGWTDPISPSSPARTSGNRSAASVREAMVLASLDGDAIAGVGFDATCSLVVLGPDGSPLPVGFHGDNERNIIVWMDHRATEQAHRINRMGHRVLDYVGGVISPEMETPKLLWLKENLPATYGSAWQFFDLADFLTWRATG